MTKDQEIAYENIKETWRPIVMPAGLTYNQTRDHINELVKRKDYRIVPYLGNFEFPGGPPTAVEALTTCFDAIPDNLKYPMTLDVHMSARKPIPIWIITQLHKYRPNDFLGDLAADIQAAEVLTVYRGSRNDQQTTDISTEVCWSLRKDVALTFCQTIIDDGSTPHLYQASIHRNDICAYTDGRDEAEVLQFGKVFDVQELPIIRSEMEAAIARVRRQIQKLMHNSGDK